MTESLLDDGAFDEAEPVIATLIAEDPEDAASWFLRARLLAGRGRHAEAQQSCRRALELWPDILPVYRLLSELAQKTDDVPDSWLAMARRMLLAQQPDDAIMASRIGGQLCAEGRFGDALPFLRIAAPVLGHQDSAVWNYSLSLALTGSYHELVSIEPMLVAFARDVPPPFSPFVHLAAAKLALHVDPAAVQRDIAATKASAHWLNATELVEQLRHAIDEHQAFSVIRLSETHARLVTYASLRAHLLLHEAEMSAVVNSVWTEASGEVIEAYGASPAAVLGHRLLAGIADADVIAMPDAAYLAQAPENFGFLAEMQRIVLNRSAGLYAGVAVISEICDDMPFLCPLLADRPFLGFVGSNPDLAGRLAHFSQIGETKTYLIPTGPSRRDIPEPLQGRGHFLDQFEATLAELTVPYTGALFLVAAGPFGPAYCGRIKQLGGIAIDIDTIVGRWML